MSIIQLHCYHNHHHHHYSHHHHHHYSHHHHHHHHQKSAAGLKPLATSNSGSASLDLLPCPALFSLRLTWWSWRPLRAGTGPVHCTTRWRSKRCRPSWWAKPSFWRWTSGSSTTGRSTDWRERCSLVLSCRWWRWWWWLWWWWWC